MKSRSVSGKCSGGSGGRGSFAGGDFGGPLGGEGGEEALEFLIAGELLGAVFHVGYGSRFVMDEDAQLEPESRFGITGEDGEECVFSSVAFGGALSVWCDDPDHEPTIGELLGQCAVKIPRTPWAE